MCQSNNHTGEKEFAEAHELIHLGDVVEVIGFPGRTNPRNRDHGELSIFARNIKLLSPALQLPSSDATAVATSSDGGSVETSRNGGLPGSLRSGSTSDSGNSENTLKAVAKSVKVTSGVVARWDRPGSEAASGTDEESDSDPVDLTTLGKDGKINWLCSVPAQAKANLTLQWEVSAPVSTNIAGI